MSIDNTSNRYFYLRAQFKFGVWSGNTEPTAFYGPINFTKLEITAPKQKFTRLLSNMEASYGNLLDAQPAVTDPATLTCEFDSMTSGLLDILIGANTSALAQTGAAVTSETITQTPVIGVWQKFASRYIAPDATSTAIEFKDAGTPAGAGGTPAAVDPAIIANSHFEFDYINGMFRPIDSTGATAATVAYHTSTRAGEIYDAGLIKTQSIMLVGTATELSSAKRCRLQIHKANLIPNGKIDVVGNAYLKGALDGDILLPSAYPSGWRFEYLDLAA